MPSGRVDTMSDFLRQIMGSLSEAKLVADADLPFLLQIEQMIVQKMRDPITRMQQAGMMPSQPSDMAGGMGGMGGAGGAGLPDMSGGAGMGGGPGGPPMPPPAQSQMAGMGGVRGVPTQPGVPNSDELRRLLTQNQ